MIFVNVIELYYTRTWLIIKMYVKVELFVDFMSFLLGLSMHCEYFLGSSVYDCDS